MRLFVSIALPQEVTDELVRLQKLIKKKELLEATFVRPENMHITLEFIGKTDPVSIPKIIEKLTVVSQAHPLFTIQLGTAELDKPKHPKTLWVTVISPELNCLAQAVNSTLKEFREPETRDFYGHITMARIKKLHGQQRSIKEIAQLKIQKLAWQVTQFELMASQLTDQAPKYSVIQEFILNAPK